MKTILYTLLLSTLFVACNTNDYKDEYVKEVEYDGYSTAIDSVVSKNYYAIIEDGKPVKKELQSETTKWYDLNGFHSMTVSFLYVPNGVRKTVEKITRDKHSLPVAKDISIESPNTETAVTLARLKRRSNGKEEWLFRHYFDPQRYLEDATTILYTDDSKTTQKKEVDKNVLKTVEIDRFDSNNRLVYKQPMLNEREQAHIETFYNVEGYVDSVKVSYYKDNNPDLEVIKQHTEKHNYTYNENNLPTENHVYENDSLTYITEYNYGIRR